MSDATMESISGSETSTAPSSLQTIVRAPVSGNGTGNRNGAGNGSGGNLSNIMLGVSLKPPKPMTNNNNNAEASSSNSETESVYNHANNLRKVSEKMLLGNSVQQQQQQQQNSRNRSSLTGIPSSITGSGNGSGTGNRNGAGNGSGGIPRLNNKALINNIAGSEMRPSSYAGPHHTIGLPVLSPSSRLNQTLPTSSANSTLERPPTAMRKIDQQNGQLKNPDLSAQIVSILFFY